MDHDRVDSGITVIGTGTSPTAVDHVTVTLGVEVVRPDAGDAFRTAAATATAVMAVLSDHGVQSRAGRTADQSHGPRYDFPNNEQVLAGYQAAQRLMVSLQGLASVDRMLSDVVGRAGEGVRIDQVALTAGDPRDAEASARAAAFADARDKAGHLASLAGRPLGPVLSIADHQGGGPMRVVPLAARAADSSVMPVATGDTAVTVSVVVHFAWAD
jgi:uncharacterized protein YggE